MIFCIKLPDFIHIDFARWRPRLLNTTSSFEFVDVSALRWSANQILFSPRFESTVNHLCVIQRIASDGRFLRHHQNGEKNHGLCHGLRLKCVCAIVSDKVCNVYCRVSLLCLQELPVTAFCRIGTESFNTHPVVLCSVKRHSVLETAVAECWSVK